MRCGCPSETTVMSSRNLGEGWFSPDQTGRCRMPPPLFTVKPPAWPHLTSLPLPPHYLSVSSRVDVGLARKLELALLILVAGFLVACGTEEELVSPSPASSAASPQTPAASPTVVATISVGSKPWTVA